MWVDICIFFFLNLITAQHQTRLVMRAVPMIDNTALDSTATDTACENERCVVKQYSMH